MLPKLYETVKPVPLRTQNSIGELVKFARDEVPATVWLEEFGDTAPRHIIQRHEHHYHLHLHEYRNLSHHVRNVVTWENEYPIVMRMEADSDAKITAAAGCSATITSESDR